MIANHSRVRGALKRPTFSEFYKVGAETSSFQPPSTMDSAPWKELRLRDGTDSISAP